MSRLSAIAALIAIGLAASLGAAEAQLQLPGAVGQTPAGGSVAPPGAARPPGPPRQPAAPPQRRPEDALPGRTLRFLGGQGSILITREGAGPRATFTIAMTGVGRRAADLRNVCTPNLNDGQRVALNPAGRPAGVPRYEAAFPGGCVLNFDLLPDAAFVSAPAGACRFADDCSVDPSGLWGPGDRELPPEREVERARTSAERRLNEARKTLMSRLGRTPEARSFIQEQAAFPALREQNCRNYGRSEQALGFCALKFTEARAALLEARVQSRAGVNQAAPTAAR